MSEEVSKEFKLIHKLALVGKEIHNVEKRGYNDFHKYSYAMEADFLSALRAKLYDAGIFIFTSVVDVKSEWITTGTEKKEKQFCQTNVVLEHTITDGQERISVKSAGTGIDTQDKAIYKAITGAMKYFIAKNFLIPTGDDPEAFEEGTSVNITPPKKSKKVETEPPTNPQQDSAPAAATAKPKATDTAKPPATCPVCGGTRFWGPGHTCSTCHPDPRFAAKEKDLFGKFCARIEEERKRYANDDLFFTVVNDVTGGTDYKLIPPDHLFVQEALYWQLKAILPDPALDGKYTPEQIRTKANEASAKREPLETK